MNKFSHFDEEGNAQMVDVSEKALTKRIAIAKGVVKVKSETLQKILDKKIHKGDVLEVARIAGIMGGKKTSDLIPMCHPLLISKISIEYAIDKKNNEISIYATTKTTGQTGIEVEALTAVSITGLTIYDMCKAIDRSITIGNVELLKKSGGKSGLYLSESIIGKVISLNNQNNESIINKDTVIIVSNVQEFEVSNFIDRRLMTDLNINQIPKSCKIKIGERLLIEIIKKEYNYLKCYVIKSGKIKLSDRVEVIFND